MSVDCTHEDCRNRFECDRPNPNYPVPAIPLHVVFDGYRDMVYIDNVQCPDDPIMCTYWFNPLAWPAEHKIMIG